MTKRHDSISLELHGPNVTIENALEAGRNLKDLVHELSKASGGGGDWEIVSVYFRCDGCGLRRPDRPTDDEGWTHRDGDDFCPACSEATTA